MRSQNEKYQKSNVPEHGFSRSSYESEVISRKSLRIRCAHVFRESTEEIHHTFSILRRCHLRLTISLFLHGEFFVQGSGLSTDLVERAMFERFVAPYYLYGSLSVSVNKGGRRVELTSRPVHVVRMFLHLL
jgi:hypothetical protein